MILNKSLFHIITIIFLILAFVIFTPKIAPKLFNYKNNSLVNNFIGNSVKNKQVDVQEFWKMREFYCPGSFIFDRIAPVFLKYNCSWLNSTDRLTSDPDLPRVDFPTGRNILYGDRKTLIYKDGKTVYVEFVVDNDEMQKAVGFFDYKGDDKDLVKGKYWLDKTVINQ